LDRLRTCKKLLIYSNWGPIPLEHNDSHILEVDGNSIDDLEICGLFKI